jgi:hypothetical protein
LPRTAEALAHFLNWIRSIINFHFPTTHQLPAPQTHQLLDRSNSSFLPIYIAAELSCLTEIPSLSLPNSNQTNLRRTNRKAGIRVWSD